MLKFNYLTITRDKHNIPLRETKADWRKENLLPVGASFFMLSPEERKLFPQCCLFLQEGEWGFWEVGATERKRSVCIWCKNSYNTKSLFMMSRFSVLYTPSCIFREILFTSRRADFYITANVPFILENLSRVRLVFDEQQRNAHVYRKFNGNLYLTLAGKRLWGFEFSHHLV